MRASRSPALFASFGARSRDWRQLLGEWGLADRANEVARRTDADRDDGHHRLAERLLEPRPHVGVLVDLDADREHVDEEAEHRLDAGDRDVAAGHHGAEQDVGEAGGDGCAGDDAGVGLVVDGDRLPAGSLQLVLDLAQAHPVGAHRRQLAERRRLEQHPAVVGERRERGDRVGDRVGDRERLGIERVVAGLDAAEVDEIVGDRAQVVAALDHRAELLALALDERIALEQQQIDEADDPVERVAQLVGDVRDELALGGAGRLRGVDRLA